MSAADQVALVDRLRSLPSETEWVEFKRNNADPQESGKTLSALSNGACISNQPHGYLVFGIDDESHAVVGTSFDPYTAKGKGNQGLILWWTTGLQPNPGVEIRVVDHPNAKVVVVEVGSARSQPVAFYGTPYVRVGTSTTELNKHPEKARAIWSRGFDWSAEVCESASMEDLDPEAIAKAREQFIMKHLGQTSDASRWDALTLLNKSRVLRQGAVTRAALLLLGRSEAASLLSPAVAKISWILKSADNKELDYEHLGPPFLLAGDRLMKRVRNLTVRELPSGTLFPQEIMQYDPWVIREALHNAIAHQDYTLRARIAVVEFPDRVTITNAGSFLPGDVATVIRQDSPQILYRNPFLADAMVELNMIDTQGGGIKRMFEAQRRRSFPMPDYDLSSPGQVVVGIPGKILDERYARLLMKRTDLDLADVILLDRVQKRQGIDKADHRRLKAAGLVEGRFPSLIVAAEVAKAAGEAGRHIRERGFNKQYYLDLILELVRQHGPVGRADVDHLLLPKLSDRLTETQKRRKVHNLLQELRRSGRVLNRGSRAQPEWVYVPPAAEDP